MLQLNLLPEKEKKNIRLTRMLYLIKIYSQGIIFALLIFIIFLLSIWLYLNIQLKGLKQILNFQLQTPLGKKIQNIENAIQSANQKLSKLNKIQSQQKTYGSFIEELSRLIPSSSHLENLILDAKTKKITINGYAPTREDVLSIKQALENSPFFTDLEWPLSNLTQTSQINFKFSFKIKDDQTIR